MSVASVLHEILSEAEGIGVAVTAVATACLWWVTRTLAKETRRLAEAGSQPHVVATLEPNRWSMNHFDLSVENTGNATAYDISVAFDPPLENGEARGENTIPLQRISVLKPGRGLSSYLTHYDPLKGKSFTVAVSWRRNPAHSEREENKYTIDMRDVEGVSRLGDDPLVQMANEIKHIREDWKWVAQGSKKIKADVYSTEDRAEERRRLEELRDQAKRQQSPGV